jgi:hypothetical protein
MIRGPSRPNCRRRAGRGAGIGDEGVDIGQRARAGEGGDADLGVIGEHAGTLGDTAHQTVDPRQSQVGVIEGAVFADPVGSLKREVDGEQLEAVFGDRPREVRTASAQDATEQHDFDARRRAAIPRPRPGWA